MPAQFTAGRFKAWDDNGNALPNARLYTYVSGTTTHKDAYTTSSLATPVTYTSDGGGGQYLAMDARGEAQLWLGAGLYTFTLKTAAGALIWSVDGLTNEGLDLAAATVTLSNYNEGGPGAVTRTITERLRDVLVVGDRGVIADGSTDDTAAFKALYESLPAGSVLDMRGRSVAVNSATLATYTNRAFNCPNDNITIKNGKFIVTGATASGLFHTEKNNSKFLDIEFVGNNQHGNGTTYGFGTVIVWNNPGASNLSKFVVRNCDFTNFAGQAWVWCNTASTGTLTRVKVVGNRADGGLTYLPGDTGTSCALVRVGTTAAGTISRVLIADNEVEATNMKTPIQAVGNGGDITHIKIRDNILLNVGVANGASNVTCYGISLKPNTKHYKVSGNTITNARQAGIYAAACDKGVICGNEVDGTFDSVDTTIRTGGIVVDGTQTKIYGNIILNVPYGITFTPGGVKCDSSVYGNTINSSLVGIKIFANLTLGSNVDAAGLSVYGNEITSDDDGILLFHGNVASDPAFNDVTIGPSNQIRALNGDGIVVTASSFPWGWSRMRITGNDIIAQVTGISYIAEAADALCIDNNGVTALGNSCIYGIIVTNNDTTGAYTCEVSNNTVYNVNPAGAPANTGAYKLYAASGVLYGNRAVNCQKTIWDQGPASFHWGMDTPWWAAQNGERVQRLSNNTTNVSASRVFLEWLRDNNAWATLYSATATW